jgi:hypothetical protein
VPTSARRSRALQSLPSWLGGKASKNDEPGGDISNYIVGATSSLPRNVGGPTMYLSATPCTLCETTSS